MSNDEKAHVRWEVWVSDVVFLQKPRDWRFNACFDRFLQACEEKAWYLERGYAVELRVRTTRYQRNEHVTVSTLHES